MELADEGRAPIDDALLGLAACHAREYQSLRRQAMRTVGSPDVADDVVQEVFTDTINTIRRGHEIRDLMAWLRTSVRNRALRRLGDRIFLPLDPELTRGGYETPAEVAQVRDQCRQVYSAVDQLGPDQRSAFLLAEVRGLRSEEIAGELNRTPAAARNLLMRARKHVREAVGPDVLSVVMPLARIQQPFWGATVAGGNSLREQLVQRLAAVGEWLAALLQRGGDAFAQPAGAAVAAAAIIGAAALFATGDGSPAQPQDQLATQPVVASPFELAVGAQPAPGAAPRTSVTDGGSAKGGDSARPGHVPAGGASDPFDSGAGAGNSAGTSKTAGRNTGGNGGGSSPAKGKNTGTAPPSGSNTTSPPAAGNTAPPSGGDNTSPGSNGGGANEGGGQSPTPDNPPSGGNPSGEEPGGGNGGGGNGAGNQGGNGGGHANGASNGQSGAGGTGN